MKRNFYVNMDCSLIPLAQEPSCGHYIGIFEYYYIFDCHLL
jgi:hypothetical protein